MGRISRAAIGVSLVCSALLLAGCPPCEPEILFAEDFERCDAPCGWDVELGGVERVETVHPSQHALRLAPGTVISRRMAVAHDDPYLVNASLVTDCTASEVRLTVELSAEGSSWVQDVELSSCSGERASTRDDRPAYQPICGEIQRIDGLETVQGIAIERLRIESTVSCLVDGILLAYPTGGC